MSKLAALWLHEILLKQEEEEETLEAVAVAEVEETVAAEAGAMEEVEETSEAGAEATMEAEVVGGTLAVGVEAEGISEAGVVAVAVAEVPAFLLMIRLSTHLLKSQCITMLLRTKTWNKSGGRPGKKLYCIYTCHMFISKKIE